MPTLAELDDPKIMAREAKTFAELCAEEEKRHARNMMAVEDGPELIENDEQLARLFEEAGRRCEARTPEEWKRFCAIGIDG